MDNLTHTLFGATLARAAFAGRGRGATAALLLASNAPDLDIMAASGGALEYLAWHRGPTHGPLGVAGLGLVAAGIVWVAGRRRRRKDPDQMASFAVLTLASVVGVLCHVLMDLPTSYGTRWLSPFDWHWYAWDLLPIVDVYLLAVLVAGLALGGRSAASRRRRACIVLLLMLANYGVRAVTHRLALIAATDQLAPLLPPACPDAVQPSIIAWWPRDAPADRRARAVERCRLELAAIPTFLSPLRWHIVARLSDASLTTAIEVGAQRPGPDRSATSSTGDLDAPWRRARRYPDHWTPAALQASQTRVGQVFLDFSRFPATRSVLDASNHTTVQWVDLRFVTDANLPLPPSRRNLFFTATVVIAPSGEIVTARLGG